MSQLKAIIRSILLALGRRCTELEFRKEFWNVEGYGFDEILRPKGMVFSQFMKSIPDVCTVSGVPGSLVISRVSTEECQHMDQLTIKKKPVKKSGPVPRPYFNRYVKINRFQQRQYQFPNSTKPKPAPTYNIAYKPLQKFSFKVNTVSSNLPKNLPPLPPHHNAPKVVYRNGVRVDSNGTAVKDVESGSAAPEKPLLAAPVNGQNFTQKLTVAPEAVVAKTTLSEHDKIQQKLAVINIQNIIQMKQVQQEKVLETEPKKSPLELRLKRSAAILEVKKSSPLIANNAYLSSTIQLENYLTTPQSLASPQCREIPNHPTFEVELVEFNSPSQFVFVINRKEREHIHLDMNLHYNIFGNAPELIIKNPLVGMSVAVNIGGDWFRAEIAHIVGNTAYVTLADTGSKEQLEVNQLRYLEKDFILPRKACKGSLFGVKPANNERFWSTSAIITFMSKTKDKKVYATVKNHEDDRYQLALYRDFARTKNIVGTLLANELAELDVKAGTNFLNAILI